MKVLITGGAGFIGSNLVRYLNKQGIENIVICDHLGNSEKWRNLVGLRYNNYFEKSDLLEFIKNDHQNELKFTHVVHLGAISNTLYTDMSHLIRNNFETSKALMAWGIMNDIKFIYASSAATYGDGANGFSDNCDLNLLKPLNAYGMSKHMFDLWNNQRPYDYCTGLKFFNVFGMNEEHKHNMRSFMSKSFERISTGKPIELFRTPKEVLRDFIYIEDVVKIIFHFMKNAFYGIYNVGSGKCHSFEFVANCIIKNFGKCDIELITMPEEIGKNYQYYTCADMEKLRVTGYNHNTFISLGHAIQDYWEKWSSK